MNDEVLVRELHRTAYMLKESQALGYCEIVLAAVLGDRDSVDILHRKEGLASVGNAAIEKVGDVRMHQPGEDLTLLQEPLSKNIRCEGQIDHLDSDLLLKLSVYTMGEIDRAHAAATEQLVKSVPVDATWTGRTLDGENRDNGFLCLAGSEEGPQFRHQYSVAVAAADEQSLTTFRHDAQQIVKDLLRPSQFFRIWFFQ
jgi:hypothetical protein